MYDMSTLASEKAITALDHSKKSTVELLDDAAVILGFSLSESSQQINLQESPNLNPDGAKFREEWILRWLIKKLSEITSVKQKSKGLREELLSDRRTWTLLNHLLSAIPKHISKDIILERNFCHTFGECIATAISLEDESLHTDDEVPVADQNDEHAGRPSKRRKLSPDQVDPRHESNRSIILPVLLRIAIQIAGSLSAVSKTESHRQTHLVSSWADGVDEAAAFIARLVSAASHTVTSSLRQPAPKATVIAETSTALHQWLELWEANATASLGQRKQDPSVAFINHALIPTLDFLARCSADSTTTLCQALERQVALHCVVPLRSVFQKRFANSWNSFEAPSQVKTARQAVDALTSGLGNATSGLGTPAGEHRAAVLIGIASRIIPRFDIVKRKADRSWIEALFLCLCCLLGKSSSHTSSLHKHQNTMSSTSAGEAQLSMPVVVSARCLDALQQTGLEPSAHFWRFYARHTLTGADQDISVNILARFVSISTSAFMPEGKDIDPWMLENLCAVLGGRLTRDDQFQRVVLQEILGPVVEEFGRIRRTDIFVKFWQSKLLEAFHDRTNTASRLPYQELWDHPDLLEAFSSMCQRYSPLSVCTSLLEDVVRDLAGLPEIVGPTNEHFARVTILTAMLKSLGTSPTILATVVEQRKSICELICTALLRSTDYQGHRWRLWKLFELFVTLFQGQTPVEEFRRLETPWTLSEVVNLAESTLQDAQPSPLRMEQYQCYSFIVSLYEVSDEEEPIFVGAMTTLKDLIECFGQHSDGQNIESGPWDGLSSTMDNTTKLLSACLARLSRSTASWPSLEVVTEEFMTSLTNLTHNQGGARHASCLATAAEGAINRIFAANRTKLTDAHFDSSSGNRALAVLTPLLHSIAQEIAGKHPGQSHTVSSCETTESSMIESHGPFVEVLGLIEKSFLSPPDLSEGLLDMRIYCELLNRATSGATFEQLAASFQFVQHTMRSALAQNLPSGQTRPDVEALVKVMKDHLKEVGRSEELGLFDKYLGYLSLAIARVIHELDVNDMSDGVRKLCNKIAKYHASMVPKQCKRYLEGPLDASNFWMIYVLLDSLDLPQADDKINAELQDSLQQVVLALISTDRQPSTGRTSAHEARIRAKLWDILSKNVENKGSQISPNFLYVGFADGFGQGESKDTLELQAQLAISHPVQASIVSLAALANLSRSDSQPQTAEVELIAGRPPFPSLAAKIKTLVLKEASADTETIEVLGHIAYLQTAHDETSAPSLIARLELSKLVLERHAPVINQHVIDSTLESITLLASPACKTLITDSTGMRPEHIFDRLCTVLSTLLIRHRRRLTGRYHLLLPALQNLLKCLFYPPTRKHLTNTSSSKATYLSSLPPWLNPPSHTSTAFLPPASATKLSRVLQQLADPSASSARHVAKRPSGSSNNNNNNNLVDEVKRLQRDVSQHTQYLLQTYCQVMLDGSIAPEVRDKLLPGLYAVMNATNVEMMRGLNAAMDASQRAIWKDLYAEWKVYGRWNQR